jgi:hypothetical protein
MHTKTIRHLSCFLLFKNYQVSAFLTDRKVPDDTSLFFIILYMAARINKRKITIILKVRLIKIKKY